MATSLKNHRLYSSFLEVRTRLEKHQFVCWIAGGAVRDFCLGRPVEEFDLVTDASTNALKTLFPEALLVGESFGVLKVPAGGGDFFDLTTFRQESDYVDGRRPSRVDAADPLKDSERRDFTINAIFWDDCAGKIVDYRGGMEDLRRQRLVCVGRPEVRFAEDYLRIIRLMRFSAVLDFAVEKNTLRAALQACENIAKVSGERIWSEFKKIEKARAWSAVRSDELAQTVIRLVLDKADLHFAATADAADFFVQLCRWSPENDYSVRLKERLKLSRAELRRYHWTRFLLGDSADYSEAEFAYEVENSPELRERLEQLILQGVLPAEKLEQTESRVRKAGDVLILAQEIVGKIPAKFIGEELRAIRISQLSGGLKTKAQVWDYLKKKYAV